MELGFGRTTVGKCRYEVNTAADDGARVQESEHEWDITVNKANAMQSFRVPASPMGEIAAKPANPEE
jgi:hypothetical protein